MDYRSGVHTAELTTGRHIEFKSLPEEYRHAIDPLGGNRYRLSIPRLPDMSEYNDVDSTQDAIRKALEVCTDVDGRQGTITRIDYRMDRYDVPYGEDFTLMRSLVFILAHRYKLSDRLMEALNRKRSKASTIRAMPDTDDSSAPVGVEYYDKAKQKGTDAYGQGRFELRRLNLHGESVQWVLSEWRKALSEITRTEYMQMIEAEARELYADKEPDEAIGMFVKRVRRDIIGREEERALYKLDGKTLKNPKCSDLPNWKAVSERRDILLKELSF